MRFRRRRSPVVRRWDNGRQALVVRLHGYGSDETQMDTLIPTPLAATVVDPRAPHRVPPGFGWWLPDGNELAPTEGIEAAVEGVSQLITTTQVELGIPPTATAVIGYSQGATLGLCLAAARPDLLGVVVAGAGVLPPDRTVTTGGRPLELLIMNGSLDALIPTGWHDETAARFAAAGHRVTDRINPVPHVIDKAQAEAATNFLVRRFPSASTADSS